jgi:hypothetical protein
MWVARGVSGAVSYLFVGVFGGIETLILLALELHLSIRHGCDGLYGETRNALTCASCALDMELTRWLRSARNVK